MANNNINFVPCGYKTLSNMGGIEIMINNCGDAVIYSWYGKIAKRWQEIKYNRSGEPFFTIYGRKYYLSEFMRINY